MFDCSDPTNACIADCVSNTPCGNIGLQTFQTCQAQCAGDGGMVNDGGSPGDAGPMQDCINCGQNACLQQAAACFMDATCSQWLTCLQGCANQPNPPPNCSSDCDAQYPGAAQLYQPLYSCTCNKCMNECATIDPCSHVPG